MYRTTRSLKNNLESADEQPSAPSSPSTNSHVRLSNVGALNRPLAIRKTPPRQVRPNIAAPNSASTSSSSSTTASLFDHDSEGAGTPLTPLSPGTPCSTNVKNLRVTNPGKVPPVPFTLEVNNNFPTQNLRFTTTPSRRSTRSSTASECLVQRMERLSAQDDNEVYNDLDSPPSPAEGAHGRKVSRQAMKRDDKYLNFPTSNGKSDRKKKAKSISRTNNTIDKIQVDVVSDSAKVVLEALGAINRSGDVPNISSSNKKNSEALPSIVLRNNNEAREAPGNNSIEGAAPGLRDKINIVVPHTSISGTTPGNAPSPRSKKVEAPLSAPDKPTKPKSSRKISTGIYTSRSTLRKPRRWSTGSLDIAGSLSPTEPQESGNQISGHRTSTGTRARKRTPSSAPSGNTLNLEPDKIHVFPPVENYHPSKKHPEQVKRDILEAIRGRTVSKPAKIRAIRKRFYSLWKELINPAERTARTASSDDDGYIYIFRSRHDAFPGRRYFKIGKTKQPPEERRKQWEGKCKFEFVHIRDENDKRFLHYNKVEKIIDAELGNERRKFECITCRTSRRCHDLGQASTKSTPTEHGEWFEISEEKALEVVNKWRDWVIQNEPYRPDGTLRACWLWKCAAGSFWMDGTENDWASWREFNWLDTFRYFLHHLRRWLGVVSPLAIDLLMTPGAIFGLAVFWYFWASGVNIGSYLIFLATLLVLVYIWFMFG